MAKPKRKSFYGVRIGRIPGVSDNLQQCRAQVDNNTQQRPCSPIVKFEASDASQSYFSQAPNFQPNDDVGFEEEFDRFASSQNIAPDSKAWRQQRTNAIRHEIIFHYSQQVKSEDDANSNGNEVKNEDGALAPSKKRKKLQRKLRVYQNMCREVGLEPLDTTDGCVTSLKSKLVNIVDYIDAKRQGSAIVVWPPEKFEEFKRYTLSANKRIDQKEARRGDGFLAALLQNLRGPNAANTYERRRDIAATARNQYTSRASGGISDQQTTSRPTTIKQELKLDGTYNSVKREHEIISIYGSESDSTSPKGDLKEEFGADGRYEVISIHDSESVFSTPEQTVKEEITDIRLGSPASSSIVSLTPDEIPCSSQKRVKRKLHTWTEGDDLSQDDLALGPVSKRLRKARSLELDI